MHYFSIDRLLQDTARLEDEEGNLICISRGLLPAGAREGDVLRLENGAYQVDHEQTQRRRAKIQALEERLFR